MSPPYTSNETARLEALHAYRLLDTAPEPVLDGIVRAAAEICGSPLAVISLVDRDRQWFKARHGDWPLTETPRSTAFSAHALLGSEPLEVPDALRDPRFAGNPLVLGEPHVRHYCGAPLIDSQGLALGALSVFDNTPRQLGACQKMALRELAEVTVAYFDSRNVGLDAVRLQALAEQSPNQVLAFEGKDGRLTYVNAAALRMLGVERDAATQLLARSRLSQAKPWMTADRLRDLTERLRCGDSDQVIFEAEDRDADGKPFPVEVRLLRVVDAGGEGFVAILRDIRHDREARARLEEAQQRWQAALENAGQGLWDWNVAAGTVFYSKTWKTMLGFDEGDIGDGIGEWDHRVHDDDREAVNAALQAHFRGETDLYRSEHRMRAKNGGWRWILDRGRVIARDDEGRPTRMIGTHTDVTYRKELEFRLETANRRLERDAEVRAAELAAARRDIDAFAAGIAHDLRAPLRAIGGFAGMLQEDYAEACPDEVKPLLDRIRRNAERMGDMIDSLRKLAHDSNRSLERRAVDMNALAGEVLAEFEEERARHGLRLTLQDLPPCHADAELLRHVLTNLLANAFKFTREKAEPEIEIGWQPDGLAGGYYVRDNGAGFDMALAGELFQPWRRLHPETRFEGTGIGLSTCARIVDRHGGRIWAEAAPGAGATFFFTVN